MSYCRWSTDDFRCDVYTYASVYGGWTTHVAGLRHTLGDDECMRMIGMDCRRYPTY